MSGSDAALDEETTPPPDLKSGIVERDVTPSAHHREIDQFQLTLTERAGEVVGARHCLIGFVDSGATADVYLARDLSSNDLVIIKQLSPRAAEREEVRTRFLREARAMSGIDHPNVIQLRRAESPPGERPFLVLEAVPGQTVGAYLAKHHAMPTRLALETARRAGLGLVAAHARGVIHRDMKPDNLLLTGPREAPTGLKVLDFGMAELLDNDSPSQARMVLGTAQYMAPEQILVESVDARTDIYGLGMVLFRMLTGHLPFDPENMDDLLRHQLFSPVPPPSWLHDDLDPTVERIVLRATRKHPGNRYPDVSSLLADLDRVLGLRSDPAPDPEIVHQPDRYVPESHDGRRAVHSLARRFGSYATLPPPSANPPAG